MRFRQYKFKFYLNARHGIYKNGVMGEIHPHTWEIVINVVKGRDETVKFHHLEHRVEEFLSAYQDKTLNDVPPFDMINPTLENICEYFKEELTKILNRNGWIFLMMEISESPSMSYVVSLIDDSYTEEMQTINSITDRILKDIKTRRVDLLVLKSLRAKVCAYLLSESERAGSLTFSIPFSRIQLADYLNCDRSALSRELSQMQRDGLLDTYKSSFKLLKPEVLKQMVQ